MAYVQRIKGGYRVAWREGGRDSKIQYTPLIQTKEKANEAKDRMDAQVAAKAPMRQGIALPLVELLERYKTSRVNNAIKAGDAPEFVERARIFAENTCARLKYHIEQRKWVTVRDITPEQVEKWRSENGKTKGASRCLLGLLRYCRDYAKQPVDSDALIALRAARVNARIPGRLMSADEIAALEDKAYSLSLDAMVLIHFLSTYGARPISAAALRCGAFNSTFGTVKIRVKSGDEVEFPLLPRTINLFRQLVEGRKPSDHLFLDPRYGQAFAEVAIQTHKTKGHGGFNGFKAGHVRYGKDLNRNGGGFDARGSRDISAFCRNHLGEKSYNLKRYAITTMLENGIPVATIKLFTGHKLDSQVLKYARTNEQKQRDALVKLPGADRQAIAQAAVTGAQDTRTNVEEETDALHAALLARLSGKGLTNAEKAVAQKMLASWGEDYEKDQISTEQDVTAMKHHEARKETRRNTRKVG